MNGALAWLNANEKYLIQWFVAMAAIALAAATFLFATKWLIVAFAIAIAVAGYTQIDKREFFNAGVAFAAALVIAVIAYFA